MSGWIPPGDGSSSRRPWCTEANRIQGPPAGHLEECVTVPSRGCWKKNRLVHSILLSATVSPACRGNPETKHLSLALHVGETCKNICFALSTLCGQWDLELKFENLSVYSIYNHLLMLSADHGVSCWGCWSRYPFILGESFGGTDVTAH